MKKLLLQKTNLVIVIFLLYSFYFSIIQGSYIYDGYHWGLVASNANDFINGKLPYKDFFVHYGFLTLLFHSISYLIYDSVFSLIVFTALVYVISIFVLLSLVRKYSSDNYILMTIFIFFFYATICGISLAYLPSISFFFIVHQDLHYTQKLFIFYFWGLCSTMLFIK